MIPRRPYLIRAMHEWTVDNGETPHLLVDAEYEGVEVPMDHVQNGKIILNISPGAVQSLSLSNDGIVFSARFNGEPRHITLPIASVLAIYSRESGQGMLFSDEDDLPPPPDGSTKGRKDGDGPSEKTSKRPNLRVIK